MKITTRKNRIPCVSLLVLALVLLSTNVAFSQAFPLFQMKQTNGKIFTSKDISPQKPSIIIYFAPDCEHCQTLMNAFFKKVNDFKKAQIVMVTFKPLNEVIDFEKRYKTDKYPNIKVGIEIPVFFFKNYYKLDQTPFTALYDQHKKLIISYKNQTSIDDLIKHLKAL